MVFDETDECRRGDIERRLAARFFLPGVELPLKEVAVFGRGNELLRVAVVVGVVGFVPAGQGDDGAVMPVVVPEAVESAAAAGDRPDEFGLLRLVLGDEDDGTLPCRDACGLSDFREDVWLRVVVNILGGIETEAVEMKFLDPVARVGDEEFAHRL